MGITKYDLEASGRTIFTEKLIENGSSAITTTDHYSPVDIFWEKDGKKYVGEIKCRMKYASTATTVQNEGVLFEQHKYNDLMSFSGMGKYYIMMFNDNVGYMFDIDALKDIDWQLKRLPVTSYDKRNHLKNERYVTYLPLSSGHKFKFNV